MRLRLPGIRRDAMLGGTIQRIMKRKAFTARLNGDGSWRGIFWDNDSARPVLITGISNDDFLGTRKEAIAAVRKKAIEKGLLKMSFKYGTGMFGATAPGQRVTKQNVRELPCGSVVKLGDGSRLIRLHDDVWLWCRDGAHCYSGIEHLESRLDKDAVVCHLAPK